MTVGAGDAVGDWVVAGVATIGAVGGTAGAPLVVDPFGFRGRVESGAVTDGVRTVPDARAEGCEEGVGSTEATVALGGGGVALVRIGSDEAADGGAFATAVDEGMSVVLEGVRAT